ncbi:hypothetical protein HDV03_001664, partial [Kappamyces sp. JEL0829]
VLLEKHVGRCLDWCEEQEKADKHPTKDEGQLLPAAIPEFGIPPGLAAPNSAIDGGAGKSLDLVGPAKEKRSCPWYKLLTPTTFAVDAFGYGAISGVTAYFLTHFHSDHYGGLSSGWTHGIIYCSEITARLVQQQLQVDPAYIQPLPLGASIVQGVAVELIDANHCPGACIILFTIPPGPGSVTSLRYLHTGDFRASPHHWTHPLLLESKIDRCYLDTTYLNPTYTFPDQRLVLDVIANLAAKLHDGATPQHVISGEPLKAFFASLGSMVASKKVGKTLFVVGSYLIGKEKVWLTIAKAIQSLVYTNPRKAKIYRALADDEINARLVDDPGKALVHVVPMDALKEDAFAELLLQYGHIDRIVAFRPTGWTFSSKSGNKRFTQSMLKPVYLSPSMTVIPVPYSEHSSYSELRDFCTTLAFGRIIPTVNVQQTKRMERYFSDWKKESVKVEPALGY